MSKYLKLTLNNSIFSLPYLITDYRVLITGLSVALSGCMGVYDGGFECPPTRGIPCRSISDINDLISQGKLPESHPEPSSCGETACSLEELPSSSDTPHIWWNPALFQETPIPPSLSAKGSV